MGNLFAKKRVVTEELENLTVQMKGYKEDIEKTFESRRMLLWYLTLLNFFLTTALVGWVWFNFDDQKMKIALSILGFIGGFVLLIVFRRLLNAYYEWRLNKKKKALDDLIEKKKTILENVKETETFKVATEILEKYGDAPKEHLVRPVSQPNSPVMDRKGPHPSQAPPGTPTGPQQGLRQRNVPGQGPPATPVRPGGPLPIPIQTIPMSAQMMPRGPPLQPIRPYHQEPHSAVYKIVDYFFGDGPSNRMALICSNCHGHNGMALPQEYEYIAFVCFLCKQFNPAKKFRPIPKMMPAPPNEPAPTKKDDVEEKTIEADGEQAKSSEGGTEDEFDVVNSQQSTDDENDKTK